MTCRSIGCYDACAHHRNRGPPQISRPPHTMKQTLFRGFPAGQDRHQRDERRRIEQDECGQRQSYVFPERGKRRSNRLPAPTLERAT